MIRALPVAFLSLVIASCAGGDASPGPSTGQTGTAPTASLTEQPSATGEQTAPPPSATAAATASPEVSPEASPSPPPTAGEGEFQNPVIATDFPDPHVILADGKYFAYATTGGGKNLQAAMSSDLVEWQSIPDPLPELASWSGLTPLFSDTPHEATWAPAAARVRDRYVLYYTTPALDMPRPDGRPSQCIGVATSDTPEGPFVDDSEGPIVCQADLGGSIDSTYFRDDDGTQYLIWKNDGNCCDINTRFFIQKLSNDGLRVVGEPADMGVDNDRPWERFVIEAPTLTINDGTYYLFFSGNDFSSAAYAVGYATADNVLGPYTDAPENPILASKPPIAGPGHQGIVEDEDGDLWLTYHAWSATAIGYERAGRRAMYIDELVFEDGKAVILGPDSDPQPAP